MRVVSNPEGKDTSVGPGREPGSSEPPTVAHLADHPLRRSEHDLAVDQQSAREVPDLPVQSKGSAQLRRALVTTDLVALTFGWVGTSLLMWRFADLNRPVVTWFLVMALGLALSHLLLRGRGLYYARVTSVRAIEAARVTSSLGMSTLGTYLVLSPFGLQRTVTGYEVIAIFLVSSLFVVVGRGFFQNWLTRHRVEGHFARDVLILGSNSEAKDLIDVLEHNPGLGYRVAGVLGYPGEAAVVGIDVERHLIGSIENAEHHLAHRDVQGVIVVESAIDEVDRHETVQRLIQAGVHVQITGGVRGVDQRRVHSHPLADSSIMYVEPVILHRWQLLFKRGLDIVVSGSVLLVTGPFLLLGMMLVKAYDRGPIFTRQDRIDQAGRHYSVWTLRTVVTEAKLEQLGADELNCPRSLWSDPYRTPIGRLLEASCVNELPQLFSVLLGVTSLVGHRPTWPDDPDAITDSGHLLRPGLTGLWRVETRYRDGYNKFLDDYYLENWSVTLDLVILLATFDKALLRLAYGESWRRSEDAAKVAAFPISNVDSSTDIGSLAS